MSRVKSQESRRYIKKQAVKQLKPPQAPPKEGVLIYMFYRNIYSNIPPFGKGYG
jgi:hypothetical protein